MLMYTVKYLEHDKFGIINLIIKKIFLSVLESLIFHIFITMMKFQYF